MKKSYILSGLWFGLFLLLISGILGAINLMAVLENINYQFFVSPFTAPDSYSIASTIMAILVVAPSAIGSYKIIKLIDSLRDKTDILPVKYKTVFIAIFILLSLTSITLKHVTNSNSRISEEELNRWLDEGH